MKRKSNICSRRNNILISMTIVLYFKSFLIFTQTMNKCSSLKKISQNKSRSSFQNTIYLSKKSIKISNML